MTNRPDPPTPLFICGVGRSGTTLLTSLLDSHPALAVLPGQTHYFREMFLNRWISRLVVTSAELVDMEWPKQVLIRQPFIPFSFHGSRKCRATLENWLDRFPNPPAECYDRIDQIIEGEFARGDGWGCFLRLYECIANRAVGDARYWVEKTPANERFVFLSEHAFHRTSRYLHMVRDPRAVVASRLLWDDPPGVARQRALVTYCHGWARSVYQSVQNAEICDDRYRVLRYEDLVEDPRGITSQIASFLDVEPTESLLTPTALGEAHPMNSSHREYRDATPGIVGTQVGRFTETLTQREIGVIECMLGDQMKALGYDRLRASDRIDSLDGLRDHHFGLSGLKRRLKLKRMATLQGRFREATIPVLGGSHG